MNQLPLEPGERIAVSYRLSPVALVWPVLVAAAAALEAGIAGYLFINSSSANLAATFGLLWVALLLVAGVVADRHLTYLRTRIIITNLRIITFKQTTLFSQAATFVQLAGVTNAQGDRSGVWPTILSTAPFPAVTGAAVRGAVVGTGASGRVSRA